MPVTRVNHFFARPGQVDNLHTFLQSVIDIVQNCAGCLECQLLRAVDDPHQLLILERWASIDDHRRAAQAIAPEQLAAVMPLLAQPPTGSYYTS